MVVAVETLEHLSGEWFVLDVMRREARTRQWTALLIDMDPEDEDWRRGHRKASEAWFHIPGRHKSRDDAWEALAALVATRH